MSDVSRRDALKLTATGLSVGAGVLLANEVLGQEGKKPGSAEERWKGHKLADPDVLEKATKAIPVSVGVEPPGDTPPAEEVKLMREMETGYRPMGVQPIATYWGSPRPDLNGLRVKFPNRPEVYLIHRGYRHWIPNPAT